MSKLLTLIPFLSLVTCDDGSKKFYLDKSEIVKALIIAVVSGIFSGYIAVKQLEVKVEGISKQIDKVETRLDHHINKSEP